MHADGVWLHLVPTLRLCVVMNKAVVRKPYFCLLLKITFVAVLSSSNNIFADHNTPTRNVVHGPLLPKKVVSLSVPESCEYVY